MKIDMLRLIGNIDNVKSLFRQSGGNGLPKVNTIYDSLYFIEWKQELIYELQTIDNAANNQFIQSILTLLETGFNGWKDEKSFSELCGQLNVINNRIKDFYPDEVKNINNLSVKKPKIFISHSSKDSEYVKLIFNFLESIGLTENVFCTSIPGCGVKLDEDIYDYLKAQFNEYDLHVIFILSKNYYESIACLNEMGAAWILKNKYTTFLLPNFDFKEIDGAINPRKISIKLDDTPEIFNELMLQFKNNILNEFNLPSVSESLFLRKLSDLRDGILKLNL